MFWTNDDDLTEFDVAFDVAGPNIMVIMAFHYEGDPEFTITHEGEEVPIRVISLNEDALIGTLIAIGTNLTVEVGSLHIECTGGSFGGVWGRADEIDYQPAIAWVDSAEGNQGNTTLSGAETGDVIAVGAAKTNVANGVVFTNLTRLDFARILTGDEIPVTPPSVMTGGWVDEGGGTYSITGGTNYAELGPFTFDDDYTGLIWVDVGLDIAINSGYRQYIKGSDEAFAGTIRSGANQNMTNGIGSGTETYNVGSIAANGDVRAFRIRWLKDPKIAGANVSRRDGQNSAVVNNFSGQQFSACAVCLIPAGPNDGPPWILDNGSWDDNGIWKDGEEWKDS